MEVGSEIGREIEVGEVEAHEVEEEREAVDKERNITKGHEIKELTGLCRRRKA